MRIMLDQVARAAATNVVMEMQLRQLDNPPSKEAPVPPLVKWLVGAVAALGLAAMIGGGTWLVGSVATMRETLARMDERMANSATSQGDRFSDLQRRVTVLESNQQKDGK